MNGKRVSPVDHLLDDFRIPLCNNHMLVLDLTAWLLLTSWIIFFFKQTVYWIDFWSVCDIKLESTPSFNNSEVQMLKFQSGDLHRYVSMNFVSKFEFIYVTWFTVFQSRMKETVHFYHFSFHFFFKCCYHLWDILYLFHVNMHQICNFYLDYYFELLRFCLYIEKIV